jgi:hypothetical protein
MRKRFFQITWFVLLAIALPAWGKEPILHIVPYKQHDEFPKNIRIPSPFERWNSCDLVKLLYPAYDCESGIVEQKIIGTIDSVATLESKTGTDLLILFESYENDAEEKDGASAGKNVDVAMYNIINNNLTLVASAKKILGYRYYGSSEFDSFYKINSKETAIGIKVNPGISASFGLEELYLLRRLNESFSEIFYRPMFEADFVKGIKKRSKDESLIRKISTLKTIPQKAKMYDLKIITLWYFLHEYSEGDAKVLKKTVETWRWNDADKKYFLQSNKIKQPTRATTVTGR